MLILYAYVLCNGRKSLVRFEARVGDLLKFLLGQICSDFSKNFLKKIGIQFKLNTNTPTGFMGYVGRLAGLSGRLSGWFLAVFFVS